MANFTMELRELLEDEYFELFDFEYPFYTDLEERKQLFQEKFCDHYYFDEIGFETGARFKHNLKNRLKMVMPKYIQLYESELKAKNIEFLLNKDLVEEFTRTVDTNSENEQNNSVKSNSKSASSSSTSTNDKSETKSSNLDNGISSTNLTNKLTSQDKAESSSNSSNKTDTTDEGNVLGATQTQTKDHVLEKTSFVSKGNIGVTSSASLLREWREVMINIDEMLINECSDLFMIVF